MTTARVLAEHDAVSTTVVARGHQGSAVGRVFWGNPCRIAKFLLPLSLDTNLVEPDDLLGFAGRQRVTLDRLPSKLTLFGRVQRLRNRSDN